MQQNTFTPVEIVNLIEDMFSPQLSGIRLRERIYQLELVILNDPTGIKLKRIQTQRIIDFWERDKSLEAPEMVKRHKQYLAELV